MLKERVIPAVIYQASNKVEIFKQQTTASLFVAAARQEAAYCGSGAELPGFAVMLVLVGLARQNGAVVNGCVVPASVTLHDKAEEAGCL